MEITQNTILKLIVRQGSDEDKNRVILTSGEPGYATDTKRLFIGDGFTAGGILVGNKFKGFTTNLTGTDSPEVGDYAFETDQNKLFVYVGPTPNDWRQVGGVYAGSTFIFVDPSSNQIVLQPLSAGAFDNDAVQAPIVISSGRIGLSSTLPFEIVSTNTITISSGLTGYVDEEDVTNTAISPLTANLTIVTNDVLARYDALSGDTVVYSRNLLSAFRLSAGDYIFTYNIPTSAAYPSVELYGGSTGIIYPRIMSVSDTITNVHLVSSTDINIKADSNVFFRLTY